MKLKDLAGYDLGTRTVDFSADDAILYALALGASASQLDLVYERYLRVLPTYACALGLWAVEAAGKLDAYDPTRSLHVGQSLVVHDPLQPGPTRMSGRVAPFTTSSASRSSTSMWWPPVSTPATRSCCPGSEAGAAIRLRRPGRSPDWRRPGPDRHT